ncbi:Maltose operon transcriptional repressor [Sphingobacterium spiritivorum]|uniref:Maltose operon transcriptional repressor n=1 Tax=Sphingobacterium spiritivorum TaxID=258 RepID=A0A380CVV2_SPHSI|nr:substrate-binding domain-containing protein [Sphingobacterium spiritivorum]SUJ30578.1 Maltose operon transcriptional repressor [Sphingobacterium spiritivorum]
MKKDNSLVGIKELAKLANVSIGTIDRVLHGRPGVAAKTKERVLAVLQEHDYQPNMIARALASRKARRIVVLIPSASPESAYWKAPLEGIRTAGSEILRYSFTLDVLLFDQNDRHSFIPLATQLLEEDFDALVLAPMFHQEAQPLLQHCDENKIPYVFINSDIPGSDSAAYFGPDLFQSGCMSAQLINYISNPADEILLVHISREMEMQHHLLRKEEGLLQYMQDNGMKQKLHKLIIRDTAYSAIEQALTEQLKDTTIKVLFVTNSRVASVARFIEEQQIAGICLIGFDYLPDNIAYLEKGIIDFLLCHKPIAQGYKSVMSLFQLLEAQQEPQKINYMPIDIISKENYRYYEN